MKARSLTAAIFALAVAALAAVTGDGASAQQGSPPVRLFDGKTLNGWYTFLNGDGKNKDPQNVFKIHDGMLHISGQTFGYASTEKEYENYKLTVEFKWGQKKWPPRENVVRDSGILYHVTGPDQVWSNSLECQVQEGDVGDMFLITGSDDAPSVESLGQKYGGARAYARVVKWSDHEKPSGEWNTVTVIARPDRVEHWVNGKVNLICKRPSRTKGRINLQSEGAEVYYRNVMLEPL